MHEFRGRELFIQIGPVRDEPGDLFCCQRMLLHIVSADERFAACRLKQACHYFYGRGLARAVGAEEAKDLALRYGKADVVYGSELAVFLGEVDEFDH